MTSKHFVNIHRQLSLNKSFELQLSYFPLADSRAVFDFRLRWTVRTHHAGPEFRAEILGLYLGFGVYDHRHWDNDGDDWVRHSVDEGGS